MEFKDVQEEVETLEKTGIFTDMRYTHATSHLTRKGVEQTGKIMAPRIAMAHNIVPFSGEPRMDTYMFRAYHVSVSEYPRAIDGHNWHRYINYGKIDWTPEGSQRSILELLKEKKAFHARPFGLVDHYHRDHRMKIDMYYDGYIEVEEARQKRYAELTQAERDEIRNPRPELYVFGKSLRKKVSGRTLFGQPMLQVPHPFAPAEITLNRHLIGMFTSLDVNQTREWISGVVKKVVPVGSLDALATYEKKNGIRA